MRWFRFFALLLVLLPGCASAPPASPPAVPASPLLSISRVQSGPSYRRAQTLCRVGKFRQAADVLDSLASARDLSPESVAFVRRQRDICRTHVSPSAVSPASPSVAAFPADSDCGPRALRLACREMGVAANLDSLRKAAGTSARGTSLAGLEKAAQSVGVKAEGVQVNRQALENLSSPAIAWVDGQHYVAVLRVSGETATIFDPNKPQKEDISTDELLRRSGGVLLKLSR